MRPPPRFRLRALAALLAILTGLTACDSTTTPDPGHMVLRPVGIGTAPPPLVPALRVELDMHATRIRWADSFSGPDLYLIVHDSRPGTRPQLLPAPGKQSIFFLGSLGEAAPGDEFIVELWDDDCLPIEEARRLAEKAEAGLAVDLAIGDESWTASVTVDGAQEVLAVIPAEGWQFLGRASVRVGDNGLPSAAYANHVSIEGDGQILGRVALYAGEAASVPVVATAREDAAR